MKKIMILITIILVIILGACKKKNTYKVTFMINDSLYSSYISNEQEFIDLPTVSRSGYNFSGWFIDGNEIDNKYVITKDEIVSGTLTIQKVLELNSYYPDLLIGDEWQITLSKKSIETGIETDLTKYQFSVSNEEIVSISENGLVKALKAGNTKIVMSGDGLKQEILLTVNCEYFKVSFFSNDEVISSYDAQKGTNIILPKNPVKDGYEFKGWYIEESLINDQYIINQTTVLNAKFEKIKILEASITNTKIGMGNIERLSLTKASVDSGMDSDLSKYTISSSNNCLSILDDGLVKGLSVGNTSITIEKDGLSTSLDIEVYDINDLIKSIVLNNNVSIDMTNPMYWIKQVNNVNKVLLTKEQIDDYNNKCLNNINPYNTKGTGFVDLSTLDNLTISQIKTVVQSSMNSAPSTTYNTNCDINNITGSIMYGLTINLTPMKNVPSNASTGTYNGYQETGLETGEGVVILHTSKDNLWYYVQAYNYRGWVEKSHIVITSKQQMFDYINASSFVVITAERINPGVEIRMGSKIPLVKQINDIYTLLLPTKDENNNIVFKNVDVKCYNENMSVGYLPYTTENLLKQMFKMLGEKYDWGDEFGGRDCSSTLDAAYKCFGFIMPRNTSSLYNLAGVRYDISSKNDTEKQTLLETLRPGSIILKSGHVMMYLGTVNGKCYIIHNIRGGVTITTCYEKTYSFSYFNLFMEMYQ